MRTGKRQYKFQFEYFNAIKDLTKALSTSQKEVCIKAGLSHQYTANLNKGTSVPNFEALYSISHAMNEFRKDIDVSFMELRELVGEENIVVDIMEMVDCREDRGV